MITGVVRPEAMEEAIKTQFHKLFPSEQMTSADLRDGEDAMRAVLKETALELQSDKFAFGADDHLSHACERFVVHAKEAMIIPDLDWRDVCGIVEQSAYQTVQ